MLVRMNALSIPDHPDTMADVVDINRKIEQLNMLVDKYNRAPQDDNIEVLMEVYQAHRLLDASISFFLLMGTDKSREYVEEAHGVFVENLKAEFFSLGAPSFRESSINIWEIEHTKLHESIPSSERFFTTTQPGSLSRLLGREHSVAIKEAIRLLNSMDQSLIKKNTRENYLSLTELKRSLREIIANGGIDKLEEKYLRDLIATINARIYSALESNPVLRREIEPVALPLADDLASASTQDITGLVQYLARKSGFNHDEFHAKFDKKFPGLEKFDVQILSVINSKNYLLSDAINQERYVLTVTPEMGSSRQTSERLKHTAVNNNFAKTFVSRERIHVGDDTPLHNITITEFGACGDVLSYGKTIVGLDEKLASAWNLYDQMAAILINFDANNALFPDMKPTNFLVTEDLKLIIADTKSFVETSDGIFNIRDVQKTQFYLHTEGFEPPEMQMGGTTVVEKHHAYLLGVSLYFYLTDTAMAACPRNYDPDFFTFAHPIFQSEKGKLFHLLIQDLLKISPEERLGLHDAKQKLQEIQYGIKVDNSPFKSKTEAYFYAIHYLMGLGRKYPNSIIPLAIANIKALLENHEQNPTVVVEIVLDVFKALGSVVEQTDLEQMQKIMHAIQASAYDQTLQEKFENPLARRLESQLQIELLQHPTAAMMLSVGKVSQGLLSVLQQMAGRQDSQVMLASFLQELTSGKQPTGFGSQPREIDLQGITSLLERNDPQNLNQIMFIHFLFAQLCMRYLPPEIQMPNRTVPNGKLRQIIEEYHGGAYKERPELFFEDMDRERLGLISDDKLYGSVLFKAEDGRGRKGRLEPVASSQMGIMLVEQLEDGLPVDHSSWTPDAKYQSPKLDSIYVRDLIENDAVYVAGPSGMTSLFLNIMELYGNFPTVEEKQCYLAAIAAYMVSGGFHSMHEVIGPAQYALDLVPGYKISAPIQGELALPPNYHQFYQQQMKIDPGFEARYCLAWSKLLQTYATHKHLYVHMPIETIDLTSVVHKVVAQAPLPISVHLTSKTAADRFVGVLSNAVTEYCRYIRGHPSAADAAIRRVTTLFERVREETTMENVARLIREFFAGDDMVSLLAPSLFFRGTPDAFMGLLLSVGYLIYYVGYLKQAEENHTFLSYLLNALKMDLLLVEYINKNSTADDNLVVTDIDYTHRVAAPMRKRALNILRQIEIKPSGDAPQEGAEARAGKFKEQLVELLATLNQEEGSSSKKKTPYAR